MKTLLSLLLLLPYICAFGQYSTKTVAQNRHLKVELRYKTQIAFNEADENLFSLIFTNKTKLPLKIQGVSWSLDGKDYKHNTAYAALNEEDFKHIQNCGKKWWIDTSFNYQISPKQCQFSQKINYYRFDFTKKSKVKATNRLGIVYQIEQKTLQLKDTIKNIEFEVTAFENYTAQQMADSVKLYLLQEKKEQSIVEFLTNNPAVWDYIDIPKFIQYLLSDTIKTNIKCQLLPVMKAMPAAYKQEKQLLHARIIEHIYQKKQCIFHELHDYWDDEFLIPTIDIFEKTDEDLYCYASLLTNNLVKQDTALTLRLYEAISQKKEIFFKKYTTKKDTLEHFNEWMQILSINKSKKLIPYLKQFLGDTSQVLDASYDKGTYARNHFCLYREKPQAYWSSRQVCGPEPATVEQFALDAIYNILGKRYCYEIINTAKIIFQNVENDIEFDYRNRSSLSEAALKERKRMLNEAAHYLAIQMLRE